MTGGFRSGGRSPIARCTSWMRGTDWYRRGAVGELCIGGDGLARDYLGDAELRKRSSSLNRMASRARGCSGPGIWLGWSAEGLLDIGSRGSSGEDPRDAHRAGRSRVSSGACEGVHEAVVLRVRMFPARSAFVAYVVAEPASLLVTQLQSQLRRRCSSTWCPPRSCLWRRCRWRPTARWIASDCRRRMPTCCMPRSWHREADGAHGRPDLGASTQRGGAADRAGDSFFYVGWPLTAGDTGGGRSAVGRCKWSWGSRSCSRMSP